MEHVSSVWTRPCSTSISVALFYNSVIKSVMLYCSTLWTCTSDNNASKVSFAMRGEFGYQTTTLFQLIFSTSSRSSHLFVDSDIKKFVIALNWINNNSLIYWNQEIMKVRECIPNIGPLTELIRLRLFLDIVLSSSEDVTRAMREQLRRLSRKYLRRHCGDAIVYLLISFHSKDVFCALSRLFVLPGFRFLCARLLIGT